MRGRDLGRDGVMKGAQRGVGRGALACAVGGRTTGKQPATWFQAQILSEHYRRIRG